GNLYRPEARTIALGLIARTLRATHTLSLLRTRCSSGSTTGQRYALLRYDESTEVLRCSFKRASSGKPGRNAAMKAAIPPREVFQTILATIEKVIKGQQPALRKLLAAFGSDGHVLLED